MIWRENLKIEQNIPSIQRSRKFEISGYFDNIIIDIKTKFQMPPKKVKRGGARKNGGRKAVSGEFVDFGEKTEEEKRKTYRELRANERGQVKVPEPRMKAGNGGDGHGIVGAEIGETNLSFAHVRHLGINFSSEKSLF